MQGLRTRETRKFNKFFAIVQDAAKKQGCIFFLDAADGHFFESREFECEDLMGWLIPLEKLVDFEKEWNQNNVSDEWSIYYTWAIWEDPNNPKIKFQESF